MDIKLERLLYEKYPKIFADKNKAPTETSMCWGIECGSGWYALIDELCRRLTEYLDKHPDVPQVVAGQVKQNFGGLRYHVHGGNNVTSQLIEDACYISYNTCESCGSMQTVEQRIVGIWITQLCNKCSVKEKI